MMMMMMMGRNGVSLLLLILVPFDPSLPLLKDKLRPQTQEVAGVMMLQIIICILKMEELANSTVSV